MKRKRSWLLEWLAFVAVIAFSRSAHAGDARPVGVRISQTMHAGCPTEPSLFDRLKAQLPAVYAARPDESAIELDVRIELREGTSHGSLTLLFGHVSEERQASSRTCHEVVTALVMMAAIVIGEEESMSEPPPPATAPPTPLAPPAATASPKPRLRRSSKPMPSDAASSRVSWAVGAGGEVDGTRGRTLMAKWFAQATFAGLLEPTFRAGLARSARSGLRSSSGVLSTQWTEAMFASCATLHRGRSLRIAPCVEFEVGSYEVSVDAPPPARNFSYLWLSAGLSASLGWRLVGPLSLEGSLGLRVPLVRDELFFEPDVVVHRMPALIPFAGAGFTVELR